MVDLDGTIVYNEWPDLGSFKPGAISALREFLDGGYEVVVFSCRFAAKDVDEITDREPKEVADEYNRLRRRLDEEGLFEINIWLKDYKPPAILYIDDNGLRFTNWSDTLPKARAILHGKRSGKIS